MKGAPPRGEAPSNLPEGRPMTIEIDFFVVTGLQVQC